MPLTAEPPIVLVDPGQDYVPCTVVVQTSGGLLRQLWERSDFTQWTRVPSGDVVGDPDLPPGSGRITRAVRPGQVVEVVLAYDIDFDPNAFLNPTALDGRVAVPGLRRDARSPNLASDEAFPAAGTAFGWQVNAAVPVFAMARVAEAPPRTDSVGLLAFPTAPLSSAIGGSFTRRPYLEAPANLPGHALHALLLLVDEQGNWSLRDQPFTLLERAITVKHQTIHIVNDGAAGDSSASFFVWTLLGNRLRNRVTVPDQDISDRPSPGHESEEFIDLTRFAEHQVDIDPFTVQKAAGGDADNDTSVLAVLSRGVGDVALDADNIAGNFLPGPAPGAGQPANLFSGVIIDVRNAVFDFPVGRGVETFHDREFIVKAKPLNSEFEYDVVSSVSVDYGRTGSTISPLTVDAQFVGWTDADHLGCRGLLYGATVTVTGPMGTAFYLNSDYTGFSSADFTPPLPRTGMVEVVGGRDHAFAVAFAVPVTDPVFYLGSLGSVLTLPAGTQVTRLGGDNGFTVDGNVIRGAAQGTAGPDGTPRPNDSNGTAQLIGTFTTIRFSLTPNYDDNGGTIPDGVFLQLGAA